MPRGARQQRGVGCKSETARQDRAGTHHRAPCHKKNAGKGQRPTDHRTQRVGIEPAAHGHPEHHETQIAHPRVDLQRHPAQAAQAHGYSRTGQHEDRHIQCPRQCRADKRDRQCQARPGE